MCHSCRILSVDQPLEPLLQRKVSCSAPKQRGVIGPTTARAAAMFRVGGTKINQALLLSADRAIAPISYFEPSRRPISGWRGSAKRLTDIAIASLLLAVLFPTMLIAVLAIRLESSGPHPVPPASHRLRQYRLRYVKIPHDASSCAGPRQAPADNAARSEGHARRRHHCDTLRWTNCRNCSTCCAATCRLSGHDRMRLAPAPAACRSKWSHRAMPHAIVYRRA